MITAALRSHGTTMTAGQLRDELARLQSFPGVDGVYDLVRTPQRGLGIDAAIVTEWNPATHYWDVVSRPGGAPISP